MKVLTMLLCLFLLVSCGESIYFFAYKSASLPVIEKPRVRCFEREDEITLEWNFDSGADEYLLYRDTSPLGDFKKICYQGSDLCFSDTNVESEQRYYYALAKRKEDRLFDRSTCVLGVGGKTSRDAYEDNDTVEAARQDAAAGAAASNADTAPRLEFINQIDANIYYYCDRYGNTLEDVDWYWVSIPARRFIVIKIVFPDLSTEAQSNEESKLYFNEYERTHTPVVGGDLIEIHNPRYETQIKYFRIMVNEQTYTQSLEGGFLRTYQIQFIEARNEL